MGVKRTPLRVRARPGRNRHLAQAATAPVVSWEGVLIDILRRSRQGRTTRLMTSIPAKAFGMRLAQNYNHLRKRHPRQVPNNLILRHRVQGPREVEAWFGPRVPTFAQRDRKFLTLVKQYATTVMSKSYPIRRRRAAK